VGAKFFHADRQIDRQHDEAICFLLGNSPGNYPEESIQHSEHSESLKSRMMKLLFPFSKFENKITKRGSDRESEVFLIENLGSTKKQIGMSYR
jgi:hypothetical protein